MEYQGGCLETTSSRVLIVEDSEPFRNFICSTLGKRPELQIVDQVSDGLQAVRRAEELRPDLIVLDIGLPSLNGIEAARQIRKLSPKSKILFVSQESSADVVREALGTGASGYVVKTDAGRELLEAVSAVLRGEQFVGRRFAGHDFTGASDAGASESLRSNSVFAPLEQSMEIARRHEAGFYSDDASLLDDLHSVRRSCSQGRECGYRCRDRVTPEQPSSKIAGIMAWILLPLLSRGDTSRWMLPTRSRHSWSMIMPDPVRFQKVASDLITAAAKAVKGERPRVVVCGECAPLFGHEAMQRQRFGSNISGTR